MNTTIKNWEAPTTTKITIFSSRSRGMPRPWWQGNSNRNLKWILLSHKSNWESTKPWTALPPATPTRRCNSSNRRVASINSGRSHGRCRRSATLAKMRLNLWHPSSLWTWWTNIKIMCSLRWSARISTWKNWVFRHKILTNPNKIYPLSIITGMLTRLRWFQVCRMKLRRCGTRTK